MRGKRCPARRAAEQEGGGAASRSAGAGTTALSGHWHEEISVIGTNIWELLLTKSDLIRGTKQRNANLGMTQHSWFCWTPGLDCQWGLYTPIIPIFYFTLHISAMGKPHTLLTLFGLMRPKTFAEACLTQLWNQKSHYTWGITTFPPLF